MRQLVVISEAQTWPPTWTLPDFEVRHVRPLSPLLAEATVDCVALVEPRPDEVATLMQDVRASDGSSGAVAVLLAGRPAASHVLDLLARHQFDGFLDLAWPEALASASLHTALRHVEQGRNLVEIQQVVLEQARQEVSSLYDLAVHDGLTHLLTNRHFGELMGRQHERNRRSGEAYALVVLDLDDLKLLNTRFGHDGGSKALNELARVIASSVRATDLAVRMGGDEFAVFLSDCTRAQGTEFADRLCARLREHVFDVDGRPVTITISCGVASFPEDGGTYPELLKLADAALMHAKCTGKNRVVGFVPPFEQRATS